MAEEKCSHWSIKSDEDTRYCRDCLVIMDEIPYWYGGIKIGKMTNNFESFGTALDFKELIEDHMGTPIDLTNVVMGTNPDRYWEVDYMCGFTIGKSFMFANISATRATKYVPTERFYEPKLEVVEETTE